MRSAFLIASTLLAATSAFARTVEESEPSHLQEITRPNPDRVFSIDKALAHRNVPGTFQSSKSAGAKEFYFQQKFSPKGYETKDFGGKKSSWFGNFKFATKDAAPKGRYEIPNARQAAAVKTAPTKDALETGKRAVTRELADAHRPYLGKESAKLNTAIDPNHPPRWTNDLKELKTIDDVKALLNKN